MLQNGQIKIIFVICINFRGKKDRPMDHNTTTNTNNSLQRQAPRGQHSYTRSCSITIYSNSPSLNPSKKPPFLFDHSLRHPLILIREWPAFCLALDGWQTKMTFVNQSSFNLKPLKHIDRTKGFSIKIKLKERNLAVSIWDLRFICSFSGFSALHFFPLSTMLILTPQTTKEEEKQIIA